MPHDLPPRREPGPGAPVGRGPRLLRTGILVRHNTRLLLRDPGPLIGRILMPVLVMLALRPSTWPPRARRARGRRPSARW